MVYLPTFKTFKRSLCLCGKLVGKLKKIQSHGSYGYVYTHPGTQTDPNFSFEKTSAKAVDVDVRRHSPLDRNQETGEKKPAVCNKDSKIDGFRLTQGYGKNKNISYPQMVLKNGDEYHGFRIRKKAATKRIQASV